jgi:hypothetical protein
MKRLLCLVLAAGCAAPGRSAPAPEVTWRLVEKPASPVAGDARVAALPVLVLEPEPPRLLLRVLTPEVPVGGVAELELRVENAAGPVRVALRPSRAGVSVLGADVVDVSPDRPTVIRFTAASGGAAGLIPEIVN